MPTICSETGCSAPTTAKGLCKKHYYRIYARENRDPINERRFDFRRRYAAEWPPEWNDRKTFERDVGRPPGPRYTLRKRDQRQPISKQNIGWFPPVPVTVRPEQDGTEYRRQLRFFSEFGISRADYDSLLANQGHACAICKGAPRQKSRAGEAVLCVDHDHETGVVRGLLCHNCNTGIGMLCDDPEIVDRAAAYLRAKK